MQKTLLFIASLSAAVAVVLGAFGAHALKAKLSVEQLSVFETGVRYHYYHTFALFILALLCERYASSAINLSAYCFVIGIVLFSGSLYLLSNREWLGIENWRWLGPITPLGGLCFIIAWVSLAIGVLKGKVL